MFSLRKLRLQSVRQLHTSTRVLGAESDQAKQGKLFLGFVSSQQLGELVSSFTLFFSNLLSPPHRHRHVPYHIKEGSCVLYFARDAAFGSIGSGCGSWSATALHTRLAAPALPSIPV